MITFCRKRNITYERPKVMGVVNATPDSFSGDGRTDLSDLLKHAYEQIDAGADIIDIGGESTRPGAVSVFADEESERIIGLIRELSQTTDVLISADTMKTDVAEMALDAGADIINDVNALRSPGMMELVASADVPVVIMHTYDMPFSHGQTMGRDYREKIIGFLRERKNAASEAGIKNIILDPGIGFGKSQEQNYDICLHVGDYSLDCPVLIGASRKRFLSKYYSDADLDDASTDIHMKAIESGANIVRVHNVRKMVEAIRQC